MKEKVIMSICTQRNHIKKNRIFVKIYKEPTTIIIIMVVVVDSNAVRNVKMQ